MSARCGLRCAVPAAPGRAKPSSSRVRAPAAPAGPSGAVVGALRRWGAFCLALAVLSFGLGASVSVAWAWFALLCWPRAALALLGVVYLLGGMCLWSFFVASFRSPGYTSDLGSPAALEAGGDPQQQQQQQQPESADQLLHGAREEAQEEVDAGMEATESTALLARQGPILVSGLGVKARGGQRWCSKCKLPKPDRAHHCRVCNRCILRMDHHCPWLASSCVGWRTYKAFVLFLVYASLLCVALLAATGLSLWRLWLWPASRDRQLPHTHAVLQMALAIVAVVFAIPISFFTLFHIHLLLHNRTTIENLEGGLRTGPTPSAGSGVGSGVGSSPGPLAEDTDTAVLSKREQGRLRARARQINVYDLGPLGNVVAVFGPRWMQWWRPNTRPYVLSAPLSLSGLEAAGLCPQLCAPPSLPPPAPLGRVAT